MQSHIAQRDNNQMRGLRLHLLVGLGGLLVLIPVNFFVSRQSPWWLYVLMAWMPFVAGHTGWAMGIFGSRNDRGNTEARRKN